MASVMVFLIRNGCNWEVVNKKGQITAQSCNGELFFIINQYHSKYFDEKQSYLHLWKNQLSSLTLDQLKKGLFAISATTFLQFKQNTILQQGISHYLIEMVYLLL